MAPRLKQQLHTKNASPAGKSVHWVQHLPRRRLRRKPPPIKKTHSTENNIELKMSQFVRIITIPVHSRHSCCHSSDTPPGSTVSLPSSTSVTWLLRSRFKAGAHCSLVSIKRFLKKHQIRPLILRHFLVVPQMTQAAVSDILEHCLLIEQSVQPLEKNHQVWQCVVAHVHAGHMLRCTLQHSVLA